MIDLPPIGTTITLHNGTITRESESVVRVRRANGYAWKTDGRQTVGTVTFISAVNRLRTDAGLDPLPLPCSQCGINERYTRSNTYCSQRCNRLAQGRQADALSLRGPKSRPPRPYNFALLDAALHEDTVNLGTSTRQPKLRRVVGKLDGRRYADVTGVNPDYTAWKRDADALIARREQELIP